MASTIGCALSECESSHKRMRACLFLQRWILNTLYRRQQRFSHSDDPFNVTKGNVSLIVDLSNQAQQVYRIRRDRVFCNKLLARMQNARRDSNE